MLTGGPVLSAASEAITCCPFVSWQAGIIEEMLEDTFESMEDEDEMEEEAEMEIDKILFEITAGESACVCGARSLPPALLTTKVLRFKLPSVLA